MNLLELLNGNGVTREFVQRIRFRMTVLYPGSLKKIQEETLRMVCKRGAIAAALLMFFLSFEWSFYWLMIAVAAVYAMGSVYEAAAYARLNRKILVQFEEFLNELVFQYRYYNSLEEAMSESIMNASYEISLHGSFIYDLLEEEDLEEALEYYKTVSPNDYFLMFYSMCYMVRTGGDKEVNGISLFVENLNGLISDINDELNGMDQRNNAFTGLFGVTLLPLLAMKPMELWAASNIAGLKLYYAGTGGMMITLVLSTLSLGIYLLIKKMKYPMAVRRPKSRMIEVFTYGFHQEGAYAAFVSRIQTRLMNLRYVSYKKLSLLLRQVCCELNVREFRMKQYLYGVTAAVVGTMTGISLGLQTGWTASAAFVCMAVGFHLPRLSLELSRISLQNSVMSEIIRFQAVIQMCIFRDGVDVRELLLHMEMVAVYFKGILSKALDDYSGSGVEALEKMKEGVYHKGFLRLADGMLACDVLPVCEAFANVAKDREFDIRKRKIQEQKVLADSSAIGRFIAFVPLMASVALKLILPFVMEGMNSLMEFRGALG